VNTCPHTARIHLGYDGELSPQQTSELLAHARVCDACAAEWRSIERLSAALRPADGDSADASVTKLRAALAEHFPSPVVRTLRRLTTVAAVILAACSLSLWWTGLTPPQEHAPEADMVSHRHALQPAEWEQAALASPDGRGWNGFADDVDTDALGDGL
jgi:anti-sigma factor RsiW